MRVELEEEHIRQFVLWVLLKADKPWKKDDFLDAYEEYVESLGASRAQRRNAIGVIDFPLRGALRYHSHYYSGCLKEVGFYEFELTEKGRAMAKEVGLPPESVLKI